MKKKIAIQTMQLHTNYGGILQAFALQYYLEQKGADVIHLNRIYKPTSINLKLKIFFHKWLYHKLYNTSQKAIAVFKPFIDKFIHLSPPLHSTNEWSEYVKEHYFDAVVVGSDQVWRLDYVGGFFDEFFLNFPKRNEKKIAYAASFGKDKIENSSIAHLKGVLDDFDAISVREKSGVNLIKQHFNLFAQQLLDPTLLLTKDEYIKIFDLKRQTSENVAFCYVFDNTPFIISIIDSVKKELGLNSKIVYGVEVTKETYKNKDKSTKIPIENWLQNFYNADFIVTDSFHGMVFSIIFNKPFIVIANEQRGISRFESLLSLFSLEERLFFVNDIFDLSLLHKNIDYNKVNKLIKIEQAKSNLFFDNILNND